MSQTITRVEPFDHSPSEAALILRNRLADTSALTLPGVPAMVEITPEVAQWMLDMSKAAGFSNRRLRNKTVEKICASIIAGEFKPTTQGVSITKDGEVIDGQHRLEAIVKSGRSVTMLVWFDVEKSTFDKIDSVSTARTGADWAGILDITSSHRAPVAQAYTLLDKYAQRATRDDGNALSPGELAAIHKMFPGLTSVAADGVTMAKNIHCRPQAAILMLFLAKEYVLTKPHQYEEFLRGISGGFDINEIDPRTHVRNKFKNIKAAKQSDGQRAMSRPWDHLRWLLTALEDYSKGRTYETTRGKYKESTAMPFYVPSELVEGYKGLPDAA